MLSLLPVLALAAISTVRVSAQTAFVGEIKLWPINFAPSGWAFCDGSLQSISQNEVLFSLLGTQYGGDGIETFALPDLRGVVPLGQERDRYPLASRGGGDSAQVSGNVNGVIQLTQANLPPHSHAASFNGDPSTSTINTVLSVAQQPGQSSAQDGGFLAQGSNSGSGAASIFLPASANPARRVNLAGGTSSFTTTPSGSVQIAQTGAGQPIPLNLPVFALADPVLPPYLSLNYIISLNGIYPSPPG